MTKFQLVSDLHLDFFKENQQDYLPRQIVEYNEDEKADALIIAGDLAEAHDPVWKSSLEFFASHYPRVFYILGNHEHYHTSLLSIRSMLNQLPDNITHLENCTVEFNGLKIYGSTLWFPNHKLKVKNRLSDFHAIPHLESWVYQYHDDAISTLKETDASLVITHHAPNTGSISLKHIGDALNPFFVTDCTAIIDSLAPSVWVHGHCHDPSDYVVSTTRILSNPFGYPRESYYSVNQYPPVFFTI